MCLAGGVASVSIDPKRDDITGFLRVRLSEEETLNTMNSSPEVDTLGRIPVSISEMWVTARAQRTQSHLARTDNIPKPRKTRKHGRWVGIGGCVQCHNRTDKGAYLGKGWRL